MRRVAAIGEASALAGYALAGVEVLPAEDATGVVRAWAALDEDVGLLLLTRAAEAALSSRLAEADDLLWAVVPA